MAGRSDIQAGSAYVRLWVKNNELLKGLQSSGATLKKWGTGIAVVGGTISAMGTGLVSSLVAAADHFAASGDEINKMSQRTGASVEALSALRYAADQSGVSVSDLATGFKNMGKLIDSARQGSEEARDTLSRLGVSMEALNTTPDKQLEVFADALQGVTDPAAKGTLAMKVFGKSGENLLPLMMNGAKGVQELTNRADELRQVMTKEEAESATNLGDAWDDVKAVLSSAANAIGGALAPSLTELLKIVTDGVVVVVDFVRANKDMIVVAATIGAGLVALGGVITAIGVGFIGAGAVLTGFVATVGAIAAGISTAIGVLVSGPGLIAVAVAGGVAAFLTFTETGRAAIDAVVGKFWELLDIGKSTWSGIVNAIKAGDLELAGRIALAGLNLIWLEMTGAFEDAWIEAKFFFLSVWEEAQAGLSKIFISAFAGIQRAWVAMTSFLESTWDSFKTNVLNGWQSMQKGIGDAIINAAEKSGAVSKEFATAWRQSLAAPIESDIAGRTSSSAARQAEIEANKNKSLAQITAQEAGAKGILDQDKARAQQAAFDARQAALDRRKSDLDKARADAAGLNKTAANAAGMAEGEEMIRNWMKKAAGWIETAGITSPTGPGAGSAGTFSSAAALAIGGGGVQERIAKLAEQQVDGLADVAVLQGQLLGVMGLIAKGLTHS